MIGSGGGPVAAECGPTGYNFSKGMAGQGHWTGQDRAGPHWAGQGGSLLTVKGAPGTAWILGARPSLSGMLGGWARAI